MATIHVYLHGSETQPYDAKAIGFKTIKAAVNHAASGDTVLVHGSHSVTGARLLYPENNIEIEKGLTLQAMPNEWPIIDAGKNDRVLVINEPDAKVTVTGFEIRNGKTSGDGAGIWLESYNGVEIRNNCIHSNESEDDGGGIYVNLLDSDIEIRDNHIHGNKANQGGGIYVDGLVWDLNVPYAVTKCLIERNKIGNGNEANRGGGICIYDGSVAVQENEILINRAITIGGDKPSGAGINVRNSNNLYSATIFSYLSTPNRYAVRINKNYIHYNRSDEDGGGIAVELNGEATLEGNRIERNFASDDGGGIYATLQSKVVLNGNNTLIINEARAAGGGIHATCGSIVSFTGENLVKGNIAFDDDGEDGGGGISLRHSQLSVRGTLHVVENETQGWGGGIFSMTKDFPLVLTDPTASAYEFCEQDSGVDIKGALIEDNKSAKPGSGIAVIKNNSMVPSRSTSIRACEIKNNTSTGASNPAIGVYLHFDATVSYNDFRPHVTDCLITGHNQTATAAGVYCFGDYNLDASIIGNTFTGNSVGLRLDKVDDCVVRRNKFANQTTVQIHVSDSQLKHLRDNELLGNNTTARGILVDGWFSGKIINNDIYGHVTYGVEETATPAGENVDARNNWWGTPVGPQPPGMAVAPGMANPPGDKIRTRVLWNPPLQQSIGLTTTTIGPVSAPAETPGTPRGFSMPSEYPGGIHCDENSPQ